MKKLKEYFLSVTAWFFGLLVFLICSILLLLVGIFHTGRFFEWILKKMCLWVTFSAGIRLKVRGLEHVDPQKQYIIMMNHINMMDPFTFYARFPGKARSVEEESHFKWPVYGRVIKRIGQFPINRKNARRAMETLKTAGAAIRSQNDFSIAVLPEGTRSITGKLGEFKKGGFLLALETGLDILPIIQLGAYQYKRKNHWLIRPGTIEMIYEKPIPTDGYNRKNIAELMQKTREVFLKYVD